MNNGKDEEKIPDNRTHSVCTFSNIRELSNNYCTVKVIGQKADSASPTDIWIIDLKEGTAIIENSIPITISSVFLKYYINPQSWLKMVKSLNIQQKINTHYLNKVLGKLYALEYENKVYNTIISDIIYKQNSPHFIRSFSKENTCTYDDLLDILNTTESSVDPQENLNRNTMYIFYGIKDRPSINFEDEEVRLFDFPRVNFYNLEYNYILNQAIDKSNTKKFLEMIGLINLQELYICLFQIVQACYTMYLYKLSHNDLHLNNIWTTHRNDISVNIHYKLSKDFTSDGKEKDYYFNNVNIVCRIYDFDRSYCEYLGNNSYLTEDQAKLGLSNSLIKGRDLVKILCYLYKLLNDKSRDSILSLFTNNIAYWYQEFSKKDKYCIVADFPENALYDYPIILENIYNKITSKGIKDSVQYTVYGL